VNPARSEQARSRLLVVSALLGLVALAQPLATKAADQGDANTTGIVMPGPDPNLREPSSGGPVVLRGTRPVTPGAAEAPNERNQPPSPSPYMGWVPATQYFSGWNPDYDWGGLSYTPYPQQRQ
jgi:hypothetical protein